MVTKKPNPQGRVVVTFVTRQPDAAMVELRGEFDGWRQSHPMRRTRDGRWRAALNLKPGREYAFRYVVDGAQWVSDPEADKFVGNPFGGENSVVVT